MVPLLPKTNTTSNFEKPTTSTKRYNMITTVSDTALNRGLQYLHELLIWRLSNPLGDMDSDAPVLNWEGLEEANLVSFFVKYQLNANEQIAVLLGLAPHLNPALISNAVTSLYAQGAELPELGGVKGKNHRGILPTGETLQFVLAGLQSKQRLQTIDLFAHSQALHKNSLVHLGAATEGEPFMSGVLSLSQEALLEIGSGTPPLPQLSTAFPAEQLQTQLEWEDLILDDATLGHIRDLEIWLTHNETLLEKWGMKGRLKPGYRVLMHGPPGTGKTLTASLLGRYTQRPVYRIDLSTVVSKYIGETEKNLASLFDRAAHKNWILFFDEADSIFGKRTNVRDAHDKYANQEVSYLLQRIESHPGLVLLASNFKDNIDEAFTRRFQSIIEFKLPGARERLSLWKRNLPEPIQLAADVDLETIARQHELTGSNIVNVIQYCALMVLNSGSNILSHELLLTGIRKEYIKENRLFK